MAPKIPIFSHFTKEIWPQTLGHCTEGGGTPKMNIDKLIPIWAVLLLFSASPPGRPADQQAIQNSTFWSELAIVYPRQFSLIIDQSILSYKGLQND